MGSPRRLIVNADDFGQSAGVNAGVVRCHRNGIVTSASLMVRWPAALEAASYARCHPDLSVGLHADLGEWTRREGGWLPRYLRADPDDAEAVQCEIRGQLERFRELTGRDPTHIDGHQHVQKSGHAGRILQGVAEELGVVLRDRSDRVRHVGGFYGRTRSGDPYPEGVTAERLLELLSSLPPGVTELGCHPGLDGDVDSDYVEERSLEVLALCDPRLRRFIEDSGIELVSFPV